MVAQKIHPQIIIKGWRQARDTARQVLEEIGMNNSEDKEAFKQDLKNIAMTTLSSKLLLHDREAFADLAVEAVLRLKGSNNIDFIKLIKKPGGSLGDSFLADGMILEKTIATGCPKRMEKPRVLIANTPMDHDKIKIMGSKVKVDSMTAIGEIEEAEKAKMKAKVDKILAHKPNVFINRQLIYNYPE